MYLYAEMVDTHTMWYESHMGCRNLSSCKRIVKVKLTEEQIEQLKPRSFGYSEGKEQGESVNLICLQEE